MKEQITAAEWKYRFIANIDSFAAAYEHDNLVNPFRNPHKMLKEDWDEKFVEWLNELNG